MCVCVYVCVLSVAYSISCAGGRHNMPPPPASWPLTSFDLENGVTCEMGYFCANFSLPMPLCSRHRPDVRDRQTDVRRASSLNAPPYGRGIISCFQRGTQLPKKMAKKSKKRPDGITPPAAPTWRTSTIRSSADPRENGLVWSCLSEKLISKHTRRKSQNELPRRTGPELRHRARGFFIHYAASVHAILNVSADINDAPTSCRCCPFDFGGRG